MLPRFLYSRDKIKTDSNLALSFSAGGDPMHRKNLGKALFALALFFPLFIKLEVGLGTNAGLLPLAVWRILTKPVVVSCGLGVLALWLWGECFFKRTLWFREWLYTFMIMAAPFLMTLICETACNADLTKMNPVVVFGDFGIAFVVMAMLYPFFRKVSRWLGFLFVLSLLAGCLEYYVLQFRGVPLMMVDLLAWRAAAAVMGNYRFTISTQLAAAILLTGFFMAFAASLEEAGGCRCSRYIVSRRKWVKSTSALVMAAVLGFWFWRVDLVHMGYLLWDWNPVKTYNRYGLGVSFLMSGQLLIVREPDGYSTEEAEKLLHPEPEYHVPGNGSVTPSVVIVMNESFSDLGQVGPLRCTADHMAFFKSLQRDAGTLEFGRAYVSAFGAQTCNSEFEFLTGASMFMLPTGAPYTQYDFSNVVSLVASMNDQGYETIAVHPENPANWRRNLVYDGMRFARFLSYKDFPTKAEKIFGSRISDAGDYRKVIELFEGANGPVFIHNVTMQNHGSYNINFLHGRKLAEVDAAYSRYSDFIAYETLIRESDRALRELINYLRKQKYPVIICFFGDHQPKLNSEFSSRLLDSGRQGRESELEIQQRSYMVPYFIWANYVPECRPPVNVCEDGQNMTSLNYLGAAVRCYAGLKLTPVERFLLKMRRSVPAINVNGYYAGGRWHRKSERNIYSSLLQDYSFVQHYILFDENKKKELTCADETNR